MKQTSLRIRRDAGLKRKFDALCTEFGITLSMALLVFARAEIQEKRIPTEMKLDVPNA